MDTQWGIIGTGQIAKKFAEDYHAVSDGKILAVASRKRSKAEEFAQTYGIARAYGSYQEMMEDPEVNAVYVATPHSYHRQNSVMALKKDKAVLCEKPVALNARQLKEIVDIARQHNVLFMEALWTYFLPPVKQAMQWISQGEIGQVQLIKANFGFSLAFDAEHRVYNPQLGGGALLDVGIYPIALASLVMQQSPQNIEAFAKKGPTQVDHTTVMNFYYPNNAIAQLDCSVENHTNHEGIIYGEKGHIYLPDFWRARKAMLKTSKKYLKYEDTRKTAGYNYEIEAMNNLLKAGKTESEVMPLSMSFMLTGILDQVRQKIQVTYPGE